MREFLKWIIPTIIALIAAGGGFLAWKNLFEPYPVEPEGTAIIVSVGLDPKSVGFGGASILKVSAKSTYGRPIRGADVQVKTTCSYNRNFNIPIAEHAGGGSFEPPGTNSGPDSTELNKKTDSDGIFTARWHTPKIKDSQVLHGVCRFDVVIKKKHYSLGNGQNGIELTR